MFLRCWNFEVAEEGIEASAGESEKSGNELRAPQEEWWQSSVGKRKGKTRKPQKTERSLMKRRKVADIDVLDSMAP